ncbi:hypothetical protein WJX84_009237 [Apatococcus fuscideae]|uniref:Protein kinase domain-containing protein n=1 Tax=Apatococcus fuscideae TaxID=2026836 RepID=A0AAW1SMU8_9CHLO
MSKRSNRFQFKDFIESKLSAVLDATTRRKKRRSRDGSVQSSSSDAGSSGRISAVFWRRKEVGTKVESLTRSNSNFHEVFESALSHKSQQPSQFDLSVLQSRSRLNSFSMARTSNELRTTTALEVTNAGGWSIVNKKYLVVKAIGSGEFGKVKMVINLTDMQLYALKTVSKARLQKSIRRLKPSIRRRSAHHSPLPIRAEVKVLRADAEQPLTLTEMSRATSMPTFLPKSQRFRSQARSITQQQQEACDVLGALMGADDPALSGRPKTQANARRSLPNDLPRASQQTADKTGAAVSQQKSSAPSCKSPVEPYPLPTCQKDTEMSSALAESAASVHAADNPCSSVSQSLHGLDSSPAISLEHEDQGPTTAEPPWASEDCNSSAGPSCMSSLDGIPGTICADRRGLNQEFPLQGVRSPDSWTSAGSRFEPSTSNQAAPSELIPQPESKDSSRTPSNAGATSFSELVQEIAVMKKLAHPNIVKLHEVIDDPSTDSLLLVMEYVDGGTLEQAAKGEGAWESMPEKLVQKHVRDICRGLDYLHFNNTLHGDLKPANLLRSSEGRIKIADFGSALIYLESEDTYDGPMNGTPAFRAPETLLKRRKLTSKMDVWALGVCIYCWIFGHLPFVGQTILETFEAIKNDELTFNDSLECSEELRDLLCKMLTKDPQYRLGLNGVMRHAWTTGWNSNPLPTMDSIGNEKVSVDEQDVAEAISDKERADILPSVMPIFKEKHFSPRAILGSESTSGTSIFLIADGLVQIVMDAEAQDSNRSTDSGTFLDEDKTGIMSAKSLSEMVADTPRPNIQDNGRVVIETAGPGDFAGLSCLLQTGRELPEQRHPLIQAVTHSRRATADPSGPFR